MMKSIPISTRELPTPLVINGHGAKTNKTFEMGNHLLMTPGDLKTSYVFAVEPSYAIESDFNIGVIKPVKNGQWTVYDKQHNPQVNEVAISPWHKNEVTNFAKTILKDPSLWSQIDHNQGLYLHRDTDTHLVVKRGNDYLHLNATEAEAVFKSISNNTYHYATEGTPLFIYAPKVGKVKVFSETSLSEVLDQVEAIAGPKLVMLATCNASYHNTTISYQTDGKSIAVSDLIHQQQEHRSEHNDSDSHYDHALAKLSPGIDENPFKAKPAEKIMFNDVISDQSSLSPSIFQEASDNPGNGSHTNVNPIANTGIENAQIEATLVVTPLYVELQPTIVEAV